MLCMHFAGVAGFTVDTSADGGSEGGRRDGRRRDGEAGGGLTVNYKAASLSKEIRQLLQTFQFLKLDDEYLKIKCPPNNLGHA